MAINYSTVITKEDLESISEQEYRNIKLICEAKKKADDEITFFQHGNEDCKTGRAFEFAFRNRNFVNEPYHKKVLIAANALFYDNEQIINILLNEKNLKYKLLASTINRMSRIKELALLKDEYELDESTTISDKNLNTICKTIRKYYKYNSIDDNFIIAKLVEIVVFDKELYLSLEGGKQKTYLSSPVK